MSSLASPPCDVVERRLPTKEAADEFITTLRKAFGHSVGVILVLAQPEADGDGLSVNFRSAHLATDDIIDILDDIADRLAEEERDAPDAPAGRA